jgi:segregation and condensation protein B
LILGSPEPISAQRVAAVIPYCKPAQIAAVVAALNTEYSNHGRSFEIHEVAGGYQVRTLPEYAVYLQQIQPQRPLRLSSAALETLAIVAYRQPVTRAEVENVRGVDAGAVLRSLLERKLLRLAGHKEVPGRPMLYATTRRFLEVFGLDRIEGLPSLREVEELAPRATLGGSNVADEADGGELELDLEASDDAVSVTLDDAEPVGKPH